MKRTSSTSTAIIAIILATVLIGGGNTWAAPPGGFQGKQGVPEIPQQHGKPPGGGPAKGAHFHDKDRVAVRNYYAELGRSGQCPPGLAKKHNGCMPPGQAKKQWRIGAPLPAGVVTYSLPPELVVQLTPPPVGYQYVRVASDILMIAAGTGMVAAAIQDLGR